MVLGDSPAGIHDMRLEYEYSIKSPIGIFPVESVSHTYPDSMYRMPTDELDRLYLERDPAPAVYLLPEVPDIVERYEVYRHNNHYVEAQVWDKEPLKAFMNR